MVNRKIFRVCAMFTMGLLLYASSVNVYATNDDYHFDEDVEYEKLTLTDFGFEGKTEITEGQSIVKTAGEGTLHGVEIEGVYSMSVGLDNCMLFFGGERNGVWVIPQDSETLRFAYIDPDGTHKHPVNSNNNWNIKEGDLRVAGMKEVSLTNAEIKLKMGFLFEEPNNERSNLKVTVTINDVYTDFFILEDISTNSLKRTVFAFSNYPMSIIEGEWEVPTSDVDDSTSASGYVVKDKKEWLLSVTIGVAVVLPVIFGGYLIMDKVSKRKKEVKKHEA